MTSRTLDTTRKRRVTTKPTRCRRVLTALPGRTPRSKPVLIVCKERRAARGLCMKCLELEAAQKLERKKAERVNNARRATNAAVARGDLPRSLKGTARVFLQRQEATAVQA